jgi:hypothetical protein
VRTSPSIVPGASCADATLSTTRYRPRFSIFWKRPIGIERVTNAMSDTALAYLISLGILGFGVVWLVASAHSAAPAVYVAIGIPTVAVGLASLFTERRN